MITRVEIVRHEEGPDSEQPLQVAARLGEEALGLRVLHVSDVLAQNRGVPGGQAQRVFQVGANREERRRIESKWDRFRDETARAPEDARLVVDDTDHRIILPHVYAAIVHDDQIRDAFKSRARLFVRGDNRLVRNIPARHHQRPAVRSQQQMLKRSCGQERSDLVQTGRNVWIKCGITPDREQDDRPAGRHERRARYVVDDRCPTDGLQILEHHSEGLVPPPLPLPQPADGLNTCSVAHEVEAPEAFRRDDVAALQSPDRSHNRILRATGLRPQAGPALGTRVGLGVESSRGRVGVFESARAAHRERGHRGAGPVVGNFE